MRALWTIAAFELKQRLKQISTPIYFVLFGAIAGLWMAAAGGAISGAFVSFDSEKILINSPYALMQGLTILGFMGVTVIAALSGRAVQQDFEHGTWHFLFTAPIRKRDYFFGRFIGAWLSLCVIFLGIAAGFVIGIHWPGVDASRVGPMSTDAFVRPYLFMLLPNVLWMGSVFFVTAALSRQMAPVYIAGVLVLLGYLLSFNLLNDMDNKTLAALVDPVGSEALSVLTRYWSVSDKNTRPISLEGVLLWNRAIWLGFAAIVTLLGYLRFRMDAVGTRASKRAKKIAVEEIKARPISVLPSVVLDRSTGAWLRLLPNSVRLHLREILRSPRFVAIVLGGLLFMIGNASTMGSAYGTNAWPLTYQVLEATSGLFRLFLLVVTAIYAGELVWREREARIDEIIDTTPQPDWLPFTAKLSTLFVIQALLLGVVMLGSIGIQLWYHYTRLELGHYLYELYLVQLPSYWTLAALTLTIHVLVNQKYLAHFLVTLWFLISLKLPDFGFEDRLYRFASTPPLQYSDINGYGHFLPAVRWFQLYWGAVAVLLLALAKLLWVRGKETNGSNRMRLARKRLSGNWIATAAGAALLTIGSGAWIYYNTHVLNPFRSKYGDQQLQAEYEKRYKNLVLSPQPKITAIKVALDLYPAEHRAVFHDHYTLQNKTDQPIKDLYLRIPRTATIRKLESSLPLTLIDSAPDMSWWHYRFQRTLAVGDTAMLEFELEFAAQGFRNDGAASIVVDNGSFLNGAGDEDSTVMPSIGYSEQSELESDRDRKKFGLEPKERMHDLDDNYWQQVGALGGSADWIDYQATISTASDQLAVTSGDLVKEWTEGDRHYFHYEMDGKIAPLFTFQSGRYTQRKDHWSNGKQQVDIEIDYQLGHEFDLDRMIAGVKDSLDYYTQHYAPYQHHIVRIIEFPRYARFAESLPNTIPYSEAIGFITRVDDQDPKDIDYPYFVTAHEVAHQWWAHQELPADVQGAEFITESLAEYSALVVLKHKYGDARMHRFLRYELDRYLFGRSQESKKEQPLIRADGPSYLHYSKGSLALYALQDAIGEDKVNEALSAFVTTWRFKGPPYAISRDLLAEFRKVTPPDSQVLIDDLFERITLFDNRATQASARKLDDGRYAIDITVLAKKFHADGLGKETEAAMDEGIDIGALDDKDQPMLIRKERMHSGENHYTLVVDTLPHKAGIDPLNKLIDRTPEDNVVKVSGG